MWFIIFIIIIVTVYIIEFREEFSVENLEKSALLIGVILLMLLIIGIMKSMVM